MRRCLGRWIMAKRSILICNTGCITEPKKKRGRFLGLRQKGAYPLLTWNLFVCVYRNVDTSNWRNRHTARTVSDRNLKRKKTSSYFDWSYIFFTMCLNCSRHWFRFIFMVGVSRLFSIENGSLWRWISFTLVDSKSILVFAFRKWKKKQRLIT